MKAIKTKLNANAKHAAPAVAGPQNTHIKKAGIAKTAVHIKKTRAKVAKPAPAAGKIDAIVKLMSAKHGASIEQLVKVTGWQRHSVRGAISGTVKKRMGLKVTSERVNDVRVYRIGK